LENLVNSFEKKRNHEWHNTACNGRFDATAAVAPQKRQWEFGSLSPARTFVNPRLREAAGW